MYLLPLSQSVERLLSAQDLLAYRGASEAAPTGHKPTARMSLAINHAFGLTLRADYSVQANSSVITQSA